MDDETYHLLTNKFKSERGYNRQQIQVLQGRIQYNQVAIDEMKRFRDTVAHHSQIEKITREALHELVEYIIRQFGKERSTRRVLKSAICI